MEHLGFVLFAVALVGIFVVWWNSPAQVNKRRLAAARAVPMRDLVPDAVQKVTGVVEPIQELESPLAGVRCVYWHLEVEQPQGKNSWRTIAEDRESRPFWLVDPSGRIYVDLLGVSLHLESDQVGSSSIFDGNNERELMVLERLGVPATGLLGMTHSRRFKEARLDVGERVSVMGKVVIVEVDGKAVFSLVAGPDGLRISDSKSVHG